MTQGKAEVLLPSNMQSTLIFYILFYLISICVILVAIFKLNFDPLIYLDL